MESVREVGAHGQRSHNSVIVRPFCASDACGERRVGKELG
jgi:hypothetical protein